MSHTVALYQPPAFQQEGIFVSVHLNSNRPVQIVTFLHAIEHTAHYPERVEVIINIDTGDEVMIRVLQEQQQALRVRVRWIETDIIKSFADTWKPYNLILPMTDPNAYFIILLSDEMLFEEKGWDEILTPYIGYFPDHIFRLRASVYRWRNYTDVWECGFAPDSVCFYTRSWLMIQGGWNPCNGPDSFQQCVSYYLSTSDPFSQTHYHRDLVIPFMRFSGEGVSVGMDTDAHRRRVRISTRMWFILMSHRYQQEARRRAMLLKAHILAFAFGKELQLTENTFGRSLTLRTEDYEEKLSYQLSWIAITLRNIMRGVLFQYYGGGGAKTLKRHPRLGLHFICDAYWSGYETFQRKRDACILAYYRWRNTKINHMKGHAQRYPRILAIINGIGARVTQQGLLRGSISALRRALEKLLGK